MMSCDLATQRRAWPAACINSKHARPLRKTAVFTPSAPVALLAPIFHIDEKNPGYIPIPSS